jgi:Glycosyl hydrolase family 76
LRLSERVRGQKRAVRAAAIAGAAVVVIAIPAASPAAGPTTRTGLCSVFCGRTGGPGVIDVQQLRGDRVRLKLLMSGHSPLELVVERSSGGRLARARPTLIDERPRELLTGRYPVRERLRPVTTIRLRALQNGAGTRVVDLNGSTRSLGAGLYVLQADAVTRAGRLRRRGSSIVLRIGRDGRITYVLQLHAAAGATTAGARSVTQIDATVKGEVDPYDQATTYYFQYGNTAGAYGSRTAPRRVRTKRRLAKVSAGLTGLSLQTTYHYRLVATNCGGCGPGTSYGPDRTFTTLSTNGLSVQQIDADRAVAAYNAMQQHFYAANVYRGDRSRLYVESDPESGNRYSFLWPFSRALVGTITLRGIPSALLGGASYRAAVDDRLTGLSRYLSRATSPPGYDSYPPAPYGGGGDKYYDDQAWIGLATAQNYLMTGNRTSLADAERVFNYVYPGGWAGDDGFDPGGIFWVNQGVGVGVKNHNRTTNSTTPNAELALLLANLNRANAGLYEAAGTNMYEWANHYLYNVAVNPTDPAGPNPNFDSSQPALMFDKLRGDDTVDHRLWSYNQGAMIAANVREYQATHEPAYLVDAEAIASTALDTFSESEYLNDQPAAFNGIFFRGLLVLYSATSDAALQARIIQTIQTYADDAWSYYRSSNDLFRFPSSAGSGYQLLDQGAMVQIYAMLAWNPAQYGKLP